MKYEPINLGDPGTTELTVLQAGRSVSYYSFESVVAGESGGLFANVQYKKDGQTVQFIALDENGNDVMGKSRSLAQTTIPDREIHRLEQVVQHFHEKASDPASSSSVRSFLREFKLPSPKEMPEAYRLVGRIRKRLVVCWGYETSPHASFLPLSPVAVECAKTDNSNWVLGDRLNIRKQFFDWRKVCARMVFAGLVLAGLAYCLLGVPVRCHHGTVIGHGVHGMFAQRACPLVCTRPGCGQHLEADMSCPSCRCVVCGAKRQLTVEGECKNPPDEEKCMATVGLTHAHRCGRHCRPADRGQSAMCENCKAIQL